MKKLYFDSNLDILLDKLMSSKKLDGKSDGSHNFLIRMTSQLWLNRFVFEQQLQNIETEIYKNSNKMRKRKWKERQA